MNGALWAAVAVLLLALIVCLLRLLAHRRAAMRLSDEIRRFLDGEIALPMFSVQDNRFAVFENAVIELETRLLASQERARVESAQSRSFVQDVSHQFKTPIAGLRLFCEVDESPHKAQMLGIIGRMESLINALLKLETLRCDGYAFHYAPTDLNALAKEVRAQFTPLYPQKQIDISGDGQIRCDARWMYEALTNLIKNACEHTLPNGRIRVSIDPSDREVILRVEDDGGGVAPEVLPRLFERFYRGLNPGQNQGVGLGLAIVKTIVQKHHGSIAAANGESGLVITIYLPVLRDLLKKT